MYREIYSAVDLTSYDFFSKFLVNVQSDIDILINKDFLFMKSKSVTISLYTQLLFVVQINWVVGKLELAS